MPSFWYSEWQLSTLIYKRLSVGLMYGVMVICPSISVMCVSKQFSDSAVNCILGSPDRVCEEPCNRWSLNICR